MDIEESIAGGAMEVVVVHEATLAGSYRRYRAHSQRIDRHSPGAANSSVDGPMPSDLIVW